MAEKVIKEFDYIHQLEENEKKLSRSSPIKNKDGKIEGTVVISFDIEERIKMEEALKESNKKSLDLIEELKKTEETRKGFLSSLSHELRNPLATIELALDLMDFTEGNMDEQRKIRETIKRQTNQLVRLVDDLLNMTRITQNKFVLSLEKIQVNMLLEEIFTDNILSFRKKGIILEADMPQERIIIQGDKTRLKQVIRNILSNSLKFTPEKGNVTMTLKKDQTTKEVLISIKDTGKGIPDYIVKEIFEPYVQVRNNLGKSSGGLGLGLAIAKDIVERHKGSLKALSGGENMGTEILMRLPILDVEGADII